MSSIFKFAAYLLHIYSSVVGILYFMTKNIIVKSMVLTIKSMVKHFYLKKVPVNLMVKSLYI